MHTYTYIHVHTHMHWTYGYMCMYDRFIQAYIHTYIHTYTYALCIHICIMHNAYVVHIVCISCILPVSNIHIRTHTYNFHMPLAMPQTMPQAMPPAMPRAIAVICRDFLCQYLYVSVCTRRQVEVSGCASHTQTCNSPVLLH